MSGDKATQELRKAYVNALEKHLDDEVDRLANELDLSPQLVERHRSARLMPGEDLGQRINSFRFEDFDKKPIGSFDPRVFDTETWVDLLGQPHVISDPHDVSDDYLVAIMRFIVEEAHRFLDIDQRMLDHVLEQPIDEASQVLHRAFLSQVEHTTLMKALRAEATRRGIEVP